MPERKFFTLFTANQGEFNSECVWGSSERERERQRQKCDKSIIVFISSSKICSYFKWICNKFNFPISHYAIRILCHKKRTFGQLTLTHTLTQPQIFVFIQFNFAKSLLRVRFALIQHLSFYQPKKQNCFLCVPLYFIQLRLQLMHFIYSAEKGGVITL